MLNFLIHDEASYNKTLPIWAYFTHDTVETAPFDQSVQFILSIF